MTATLLYFDGCPHWGTLEDRLRSALRLAGRHDAVERRKVETFEEAEALGFPGSPTVLIDGRDPFGNDTTPASLSCRMYRTPEGLAGSPTVDQLLEVL